MTASGFDDDQTRSFANLTVGTQVSHYRIISRIGAGGMGEVYLAEDTQLDRKVALKFLPPHFATDETVKARFLREAQLAASLNHPNIVTVHEMAEDSGRIFIAMEYIDGQSLDRLIAEGNRSVDELLVLILQVCDGLKEAHEAGLVHRDIKPSNIMVDRSGRVRILDFGLAKIKEDDRLTRTGTTMGTVNYMSPEQSKGLDVDHRSDIFSLSALVCEMLTGEPPFRRPNIAATIHAIINEQHDPISRYGIGVPDNLQRVIDKALAKVPSDRYQNVGELAADLRQLLAAQRASQRVTLEPEDTAARKKSLAVLYLRNLGTTEDEYLSYGITEDLIIDLSRSRSLRVAPMRSVLRFRDADDDLEQIAGKLNVSLVLDGSIGLTKEKVRVAAQLVDVNIGKTLWAGRWEESREELPQIKRALAKEVSEALKIDSTITDKDTTVKAEAQTPESYEHYLRGKYTFVHKKSSSDISVALGLYQKAIVMEPSLIAARAGIAEILIHQGNWLRAEEEIASGLDYARKQNLRADESTFLRLMAISRLRQSCWDEAWEYGNDAVKISSEYDDLTGEAEALGVLIDILTRRARFDEVLTLFERVLKINRQLNDQQSAAEALKNMGTVNLRKGEYDIARTLYEEALQMARRQGNTSLEADCKGNMGLTYFHTGGFDEALRHYEKALDMHAGLGDKLKEALWLNNIAMVHEARGAYRKALEFYDKASNMNRESGDRAKSALNRSNCVLMQATIGDLDEAKESARESLAIAEELDFPLVITATKDSLGLVHLCEDNYDEARKCYLDALRVAENVNLRLNVAYAHCNLAELEFFLGEFDKCREHAATALTVAKGIGQKEIKIKASAYSSALMVHDGLYMAGVRRLREILTEAKGHGDPRYIILAMRLLGHVQADYGETMSERRDGNSLLKEALDVAQRHEVTYEIKWIYNCLEKKL